MRRGFLLPGAGLALLAVFTSLYGLDRPLYARILGGWGFGPYATPFFDAEGLSAQIRCYRQGIDSYTVNPCDPLNRLFDYSPVWLHMPFMALDHAGALWLGLLQSLGFIAALAVLPVPRVPAGRLVMVLAVASPLSVFAVERSNADVPIFCAAAASAWLLQRGFAARVGGYGVMLGVALLKFYPLVLLAQIWREAPRRALALAVAAGVILAAFAAVFGHDTLRALHNMPHPQPFGDSFGALQLGQAIAIWAKAPLAALAAVLVAGLVCVIAAVRIARGPALAAAMARLTVAETVTLLTGALLVGGCFATGVSIGYRGAFLLFAMPGLLALGAAPSGGATGLALRAAAPAGLLLLWSLPALALAHEAPLGFALPVVAGGAVYAGYRWVGRGGPRTVASLAVVLGGWLVAGMWVGLGAVLVTGLPGSAVFNSVCLARDALWWGLATLLLAVTLRGVFVLPVNAQCRYERLS